MTENSVSVSQALTPERPVVSPRRLILPLALAQFICSFAGSNVNVMINDISDATAWIERRLRSQRRQQPVATGRKSATLRNREIRAQPTA